MSEIQNLEPKNLWRNFYALTQMPRPSGHLDKVRNFLLNWAKEHSIEAHTDNAGNVIMRKAATPGYEKLQMVTMQAHMDMVPQKVKESNHDFENDPIETYIDGDWVKAKGTTLGSDDGIGVATVMAVMEDDTLKHGPLEALLTVDEETCMYGVNNLQADTLQGRILLNFDDETEGQVIIGSAGGVNVTAELEYKEVPTFREDVAIKVELSGLKGGHSGMDIVLERGNANQLLIRFLKQAEGEFGMRLASIDGGGLRNAIPREASAVVVVPSAAAKAFQEAAKAYEALLKNEYKGVDDGVTCSVTATEMPSSLIDQKTQRQMICAVHGCPNGVMRMSPSMEGVVQTSSNLARVVSEGDKIRVHCLLRSSVNSEKADLGDRIASVFELAGATTLLEGGYDGWNPNMDSPILHAMTASYEALFGKAPAVMAIHAGLEWGIISTNYPHLDMISFGPTIVHPHSPDEKVNIPSVGRFWQFLLDTLRNAPFKA